ncbi:MAG TPA: hypothetical protein VKD71_06160 [Gemmataceae bacterium]|nr:hypothetical protein [Gemmataceae bacterium]
MRCQPRHHLPGQRAGQRRPQGYKTFRTKSSKDFNPLLVAAMSVGQIVSLNYGLAIGEWPIITISSLNLAPVTLIAVGCCRYRERGARAMQPVILVSRRGGAGRAAADLAAAVGSSV